MAALFQFEGVIACATSYVCIVHPHYLDHLSTPNDMHAHKPPVLTELVLKKVAKDEYGDPLSVRACRLIQANPNHVRVATKQFQPDHLGDVLLANATPHADYTCETRLDTEQTWPVPQYYLNAFYQSAIAPHGHQRPHQILLQSGRNVQPMHPLHLIIRDECAKQSRVPSRALQSYYATKQSNLSRR